MAKKPAKPTLKIVTSSTPTGTPPPRKLGEHGAALWSDIMSEYSIDDRGGLEVLMQICSTADRVEAQCEIVEADGETVQIKGMLRAHPLLREILMGRAFITRNLQRLGLNLETVKPVGRPPGR